MPLLCEVGIRPLHPLKAPALLFSVLCHTRSLFSTAYKHAQVSVEGRPLPVLILKLCLFYCSTFVGKYSFLVPDVSIGTMTLAPLHCPLRLSLAGALTSRE